MPPAAHTFISPGDPATLVWHSGVVEGRDGVRRYQISGPVFDEAPHPPHFLLAPMARDGFATRCYRGAATVDDLRAFLGDCVVARGELVDANEFVATSAEAPVLALLDGWRALGDLPRLPYLDDIGAFLAAGPPIYVTGAAHDEACRAPETFGIAWVCDECGQADDAGVFLWTAHHGDAVRVRALIQNDAGVWTVSFHPFEFAREPLRAGEASA